MDLWPVVFLVKDWKIWDNSLFLGRINPRRLCHTYNPSLFSTFSNAKLELYVLNCFPAFALHPCAVNCMECLKWVRSSDQALSVHQCQEHRTNSVSRTDQQWFLAQETTVHTISDKMTLLTEKLDWRMTFLTNIFTWLKNQLSIYTKYDLEIVIGVKIIHIYLRTRFWNFLLQNGFVT